MNRCKGLNTTERLTGFIFDLTIYDAHEVQTINKSLSKLLKNTEFWEDLELAKKLNEQQNEVRDRLGKVK